MKNVTVAVHDKTYRLARIWAAQHGISLSHAFAVFLEDVTWAQGMEKLYPPDGNGPKPGERFPTRDAAPCRNCARCAARKHTAPFYRRLGKWLLQMLHVKL